MLDKSISPNSIGLYGINGQQFKAFDLARYENGKLAVSLKGYSSGVYIIRVEVPRGSWSQKILIE